MLGLSGFPSTGFARGLAGVFSALGLGRLFVPGGGPKTLLQKPFARNILTTDHERFERARAILAVAPQLGIGDPTIGWAHAAYGLMARLDEPGYAEKIKTPILLLASGDERLVSTPAAESFAHRLKNASCLVFPGARHEILMEKPEVRGKFWAAFDAFIPGEPFLRAAAEAASSPA
jgi:lysophospholipase